MEKYFYQEKGPLSLLCELVGEKRHIGSSDCKTCTNCTDAGENWIQCSRLKSALGTKRYNAFMSFSDVKADRYNSNKLRWSLVDFESLESMVEVLEFGAEKYTSDNWKKGQDTKEICESILRHLYAFMRGEDTDPESGRSHIGHVMCNAMFLEYNLKYNKKFDKR